MLHDMFTIGINGKTSGGLNTSASNSIKGSIMIYKGNAYLPKNSDPQTYLAAEVEPEVPHFYL